MSQRKFDDIIKQIARKENMTAAGVMEEMRTAIAVGQKNTDPEIRARWASIPKKGAELTVEEFVEFMAEKVKNNRPWS